jgi:hypothetical protein
MPGREGRRQKGSRSGWQSIRIKLRALADWVGIQPVINRAFRPTDNALVERSHRTWKGDVLVGECFADLRLLQARSDQALEDRRCHLSSRHKGCQRRPPAQAYPDLMIPRRRYQIHQERALFDLHPVDIYLSKWA